MKDWIPLIKGDVWGTQWDMFIALLGAITALATLSRLHDRELKMFDGRL